MKKLKLLVVLSLVALLATPAFAADTIKIGYNIPMTGDIPKVGEMSKQAAEMLKGRLRDDQPRVTVAATNVCRARLEYFSGEQLSVDHVVASCSIPVVFPWCEIDGELYWDGGVMQNTPIFPAIEAGATEILVVLLAPLAGEPIQPPTTTRAAFAWALDIITIGSAKSLMQDLAYLLGMDLHSHWEGSSIWSRQSCPISRSINRCQRGASHVATCTPLVMLVHGTSSGESNSG